MEMTAYFADLIKQRRQSPTPEGSAVDTVLQIEIDGRRFTDEEIDTCVDVLADVVNQA